MKIATQSGRIFTRFLAFQGSPPRGLQFTLGRSRGEVSVDTIVMANLGYFQLKANPGVWYLNLREGRSRDIYQISSHENTEETANRDDAIVVMDSFKSKVIIVKVELLFSLFQVNDHQWNLCTTDSQLLLYVVYCIIIEKYHNQKGGRWGGCE